MSIRRVHCEYEGRRVLLPVEDGCSLDNLKRRILDCLRVASYDIDDYALLLNGSEVMSVAVIFCDETVRLEKLPKLNNHNRVGNDQSVPPLAPQGSSHAATTPQPVPPAHAPPASIVEKHQGVFNQSAPISISSTSSEALGRPPATSGPSPSLSKSFGSSKSTQSGATISQIVAADDGSPIESPANASSVLPPLRSQNVSSQPPNASWNDENVIVPDEIAPIDLDDSDSSMLSPAASASFQPPPRPPAPRTPITSSKPNTRSQITSVPKPSKPNHTPGPRVSPLSATTPTGATISDSPKGRKDSVSNKKRKRPSSGGDDDDEDDSTSSSTLAQLPTPRRAKIDRKDDSNSEILSATPVRQGKNEKSSGDVSSTSLRMLFGYSAVDIEKIKKIRGLEDRSKRIVTYFDSKEWFRPDSQSHRAECEQFVLLVLKEFKNPKLEYVSRLEIIERQNLLTRNQRSALLLLMEQTELVTKRYRPGGLKRPNIPTGFVDPTKFRIARLAPKLEESERSSTSRVPSSRPSPITTKVNVQPAAMKKKRKQPDDDEERDYNRVFEEEDAVSQPKRAKIEQREPQTEDERDSDSDEYNSAEFIKLKRYSLKNLDKLNAILPISKRAEAAFQLFIERGWVSLEGLRKQDNSAWINYLRRNIQHGEDNHASEASQPPLDGPGEPGTNFQVLSLLRACRIAKCRDFPTKFGLLHKSAVPALPIQLAGVVASPVMEQLNEYSYQDVAALNKIGDLKERSEQILRHFESKEWFRASGDNHSGDCSIFIRSVLTDCVDASTIVLSRHTVFKRTNFLEISEDEKNALLILLDRTGLLSKPFHLRDKLEMKLEDRSFGHVCPNHFPNGLEPKVTNANSSTKRTHVDLLDEEDEASDEMLPLDNYDAGEIEKVNGISSTKNRAAAALNLFINNGWIELGDGDDNESNRSLWVDFIDRVIVYHEDYCSIGPEPRLDGPGSVRFEITKTQSRELNLIATIYQIATKSRLILLLRACGIAVQDGSPSRVGFMPKSAFEGLPVRLHAENNDHEDDTPESSDEERSDASSTPFLGEALFGYSAEEVAAINKIKDIEERSKRIVEYFESKEWLPAIDANTQTFLTKFVRLVLDKASDPEVSVLFRGNLASLVYGSIGIKLSVVSLLEQAGFLEKPFHYSAQSKGPLPVGRIDPKRFLRNGMMPKIESELESNQYALNAEDSNVLDQTPPHPATHTRMVAGSEQGQLSDLPEHNDI